MTDDKAKEFFEDETTDTMVCLPKGATASGNHSIAIGCNALATGPNSFSFVGQIEGDPLSGWFIDNPEYQKENNE